MSTQTQLSGTMTRDLEAVVDNVLAIYGEPKVDPLNVLIHACNHLADQMTDPGSIPDLVESWFEVQKIILAFGRGETRECRICGKLQTQHQLDTYCYLPKNWYIAHASEVLSPRWEPK